MARSTGLSEDNRLDETEYSIESLFKDVQSNFDDYEMLIRDLSFLHNLNFKHFLTPNFKGS